MAYGIQLCYQMVKVNLLMYFQVFRSLVMELRLKKKSVCKQCGKKDGHILTKVEE